MPQQYNYNLNLPNPTNAILEGVQISQTIKSNRIAQDAARVEADRKVKLNDLLVNLSDNPSPEELFAVTKYMHPDQVKAMNESFGLMSAEEKSNTLTFTGQVISALYADEELGINMLLERAEAARNSGDEEQAKAYETWAEIAIADAPGAANTIAMLAASLGEEGQKMIESIFETRKTAAETEGLLVEAKGAGTELAFKKEHGGLTQKEVYAAEVGIRKEEKWASKTLSEINAQYDKMKSSVGAETGIGDYAVVVTFIKMLEPDSVVRESEAAAARSAVSAWEQLNQFGAKLKKGETLMPEVRQKFLTLAKEFKEATEAMIVDRKSKYDIEIRDKNLSRERIWGSDPNASSKRVDPNAVPDVIDWEAEYGEN